MRIMRHTAAFAAAILTTFAVPCLGQQDAPQQPMSFFVTSVGLGDGGDLGGLAGADSHCQTLAASVGRGNIAWRAYLSQAPATGLPLVNARDRIGTGPWYNASGVVIAWNVDDLHEDRNNVRKPHCGRREWRGGQRLWRRTQSTRHSHGVRLERPPGSGQWRAYDVQQLDE